MSLIYIVRHGNTFDTGDIIRRVGGRTDLPLSVSGQIQAQKLAAHFKNLNFVNAYASKLKRQVDTANAILNAQSQSCKLETLEFLKEIDYGPDENKAENDVIARIGSTAMANWDKNAVPPQGWNVDPRAIQDKWGHFFDSHKINNLPPKGPTLIVTSNGIARFILDVTEHKTNIPRKLRTGSYGIVDVQKNTPRILSWDVRPD
ncbi:MAG: histidine phosphatase family protein [Litorimonas sp.]